MMHSPITLISTRLKASLSSGLNALRGRVPVRRGGRRAAPSPHAVYLHAAGQPDLLLSAEHTRVYRESPWVYLAVNRIAEAGALVPLSVQHRATGEAAADHPALRLLAAPNPRLSRFELFEHTLGALELTGNAFWVLEGDEGGRPCAIHPLAPEQVRIVPAAAWPAAPGMDGPGAVAGYVYEHDGFSVPLDADEVIHFRRWNPASAFYGVSALEAARLAIGGDRAMARWNYATFGEDRAVPAGIVSVRDPISESDFERMKREWKQSYGGGERRTAFLRGGGITWQHIGLNHQDLDFTAGRAAHRDEILSVFGIPLGLISANATEANATVAERQFIERTLYPKLVRLAEKLTAELLPFWPGDYVAAFDDIRPTDTQARLAEMTAAAGVLTVNERRARYFALGPVAWGDAAPMNAAPAALPARPETTRAAGEPAPAAQAGG